MKREVSPYFLTTKTKARNTLGMLVLVMMCLHTLSPVISFTGFLLQFDEHQRTCSYTLQHDDNCLAQCQLKTLLPAPFEVQTEATLMSSFMLSAVYFEESVLMVPGKIMAHNQLSFGPYSLLPYCAPSLGHLTPPPEA